MFKNKRRNCFLLVSIFHILKETYHGMRLNQFSRQKWITPVFSERQIFVDVQSHIKLLNTNKNIYYIDNKTLKKLKFLVSCASKIL